MYVIITSVGFLMPKEKSKLEPTDIVIYEGSNDECVNIIHGKHKRNMNRFVRTKS